MFRGQYQSLAHKRKLRVRSRLTSRIGRPRLVVFRSNKYTYLQVIDDQTGTVVASANTKAIEQEAKSPVTKIAAAQMAAEVLTKQLTDKNITAVALDRGPYRYHGRVKAVAETLRAGKVNV